MNIISYIYKAYLRTALTSRTIRKNLWNSFYYFGGSLIQFIIAIITQPIYALYLELEDFAIIGYFSAIQAILLPLFSLTMPFYYLAKYWQKGNSANSKEYLSFILNFLNIANTIVAMISFLGISIYFNYFNVKFPLLPFLIIVFVNLYFEKYKTFFLIECRIKKSGLKFLLFNILQIILNTGFSLYFVIALKGGAFGRMSGIMLSILITGLIVLFLFIKADIYIPTFRLDKYKLKEALKYCMPLIIGTYAYYPIGNIDRLFLERLNNIAEYGYYSIGLTISSFAGTFFLALYQSFEPDLFRLLTYKKYKTYLFFVLIYVIVITILTVLFILFSEPVVDFLTSGRFTHASMYADIFVVALVFMSIGGFFEQYFTAYGATKFVMWNNIFTGIFCIVLYYIMIQQYQFWGANITRVMGSLFYILSGLFLFIIYQKSQKYEHI